jgi:5-methylthioadenosine/S-adenosylhomocysteine deaminase
MHAAEGDDYVASVKERTGNRPIEHLHSIGALNRRVSLAHMTKLTDKEIGYLAESGAHVVNCPRANAYVKVGLCPVKELLEAGVNVCLGSDAAINNNSNDVRGEAHAVHDAISFRHNYLIDYKTLFSMLTINGARAMGLDKEIGTIEEGKRADIVLWDKNDTPFVPGFNYLADIIFTDGMRAHTVMIDGKPVIKEYKLVSMDEKKILQDARGVARKYKRAFDDYVAHHI